MGHYYHVISPERHDALGERTCAEEPLELKKGEQERCLDTFEIERKQEVLEGKGKGRELESLETEGKTGLSGHPSLLLDKEMKGIISVNQKGMWK